MATEPRYISTNLTPPVARRLRTLTAAMTVAKGSRVTTSDLVDALIELGGEQPQALAARLAEPKEA